MLTLGAYVGYVRHPWSLGRYLLVALMLALGLMSKPMVVTLPFVLLLLDYWPLNRFTIHDTDSGRVLAIHRSLRFAIWPLIREKLPLFGLAVASCGATFLAQKEVIQSVPLSLRIGNALVSYVAYLGQMIYPVGLAVYYPFPINGLALWKVIGALVLLLVISAMAVVVRRRRPYILMGWLWYLGMLVPVIGIIQSALRARADRYAYLPEIGLYMLLTWTAADLCAGWRHRRVVLGSLSAMILAVLIFSAQTQTAYWRNDEMLWTRALAGAPGNFVVYNNLGNALLRSGKVDEAIAQYQTALQIEPYYAESYNNLGFAFLQQGRLDEAIAEYQTALRIKPDYANAHFNLGDALVRKGNPGEGILQFQKVLKIQPDNVRANYNLGLALAQAGHLDEAIGQFRKTLEIQPNYLEARGNLGAALAQKGLTDEAIVQFQKVLQIQPDDAVAHNNLGNTLLQKGRMGEAILQYQEALAINPDYLKARNSLAWLLATAPLAPLRNGDKAVELALRSNQLTGGENPVILHTLAAAYAETGRFSDAVQSARKAIELARAAGQQDLVGQLTGELELYERGLAFHQESK